MDVTEKRRVKVGEHSEGKTGRESIRSANETIKGWRRPVGNSTERDGQLGVGPGSKQASHGGGTNRSTKNLSALELACYG